MEKENYLFDSIEGVKESWKLYSEEKEVTEELSVALEELFNLQAEKIGSERADYVVESVIESYVDAPAKYKNPSKIYSEEFLKSADFTSDVPPQL